MVQQLTSSPLTDAPAAGRDEGAGRAAATAGPADYIGALCALAAPLRDAAAAVTRGTACAEGPGEGLEASGGDRGGDRGGGRSAEEIATRRLQLCTVFKTLLGLGGDDATLLMRLLEPDALLAIFSSLEGDDSRLHLQTKHVSVHHVAFVTDPRRFRLPAPISDEITVRRIHQNFAIQYLTECALPLGIEPATAAALSELQASNSQQILRQLMGDAPFLRSLFADGICDPTGYAEVFSEGPDPDPAGGPSYIPSATDPAGASSPPSGRTAPISAISTGISPAMGGMHMHTHAARAAVDAQGPAGQRAAGQGPAGQGPAGQGPEGAAGGGGGAEAAGGQGQGRAANTAANATAGGDAAPTRVQAHAVEACAPAAEPRLLQLWSLLRELCALAQQQPHPLTRMRVYKV